MITRNYRMVALVAVAAFVLVACGTTPAQVVFSPATGDGPMPGISVSGTGTVAGTPDTLTVHMGVSLVRDSVDEAVGDAAALAEALLTKLADLGVAEDDLKTANYSIYPEYDYRRDESQRLIGYRVTNTLSIKIRDLDNAGSIIDAAGAEAGDELTVNGVSFDIEDNQALVEAARAAAWADARAKAEQLASLSGVSLGDPVTIRETFAEPPPIVRYADETVAGANADTPIRPGSMDVEVRIEVTFGLA